MRSLLPGAFRQRFPLGWGIAAVAAIVVLAAPTPADGLRGSVRDRLDWPGSATDRYLDGDEVVAVLHGAAEGFAACVSGETASLLSAEPVWLSFGIDPQGREVNAQVVRDGQANALDRCVLSVLTTLEFGAHDGPPGRYSYPVVLKQEQGTARNLPYPIVTVSEEQLRLPLLTLPLDLSEDDLAAIIAILTPKQR